MVVALVTGGAGFMGSHVVDELVKSEHKVIVIDDLSGGFKENINPKAIFVEGSVTDEVLIKNVFEKYNPEYVYHLAAYAAEGLSHFIRKFNYKNNLLSSINLINASVIHNVKCFVFTSSIAVYGKNQLPMLEETTPMPEDPYGISKLAVELDLRAAHEQFGLNYVIFRPHNVYGEMQSIGDKYRNVIGIFMNQIMQNKPLTIFGDGEQTRAFSYISDVAPYIAKAAFLPDIQNQIFNIGADVPYSVNNLAKEVIFAMKGEGVTHEIRYLPARNEVVHAYSSHEKARKMLDAQPKVNLKDGLERMARWAKEVGIRQSKKFENIELLKNLPPSWLE